VVEKHLKRAAELCGHEGMANHSPRRSRCTHLDEMGWSASIKLDSAAFGLFFRPDASVLGLSTGLWLKI
jgi:hypothetical protein